MIEEKKLNKDMEDFYMEKIKTKHPMFSPVKLQKMLMNDTFISATDSVNLGLADKVLGEE